MEELALNLRLIGIVAGVVVLVVLAVWILSGLVLAFWYTIGTTRKKEDQKDNR